MMEGTYYKEWSAVLDREMEFKVYGHGGVPVLALPARGGRFYDWENNGMPDAAARLLHEGKIQLFCADSIDGESLLSGLYDMGRFLGSAEDDLVLRSSPLAALRKNGICDRNVLSRAEENSLLLCVGQGGYEGDALADTQALADTLSEVGFPCHLEVWGGDVSHDWYWWGKEFGMFAERLFG